MAADEAYGWVLFSVPWRGRRFGLTVLTDGRWFFGVFKRCGLKSRRWSTEEPTIAPRVLIAAPKAIVEAFGETKQ